MKLLSFGLIGIVFGIVMTKSEAASWYRIQEMFRFDNIHMYGIIGVAVFLGALIIAAFKKYAIRARTGADMKFNKKDLPYPRLLVGGTIFGLGWALTGACPGPLYTLIGHGIWAVLVIIASAILGAFVHGLLKARLP